MNNTHKHEAVMSLIDMQDYTPAARRYWWTVVVLGIWALVYSVANVSELHGLTLVQVLVGALVAAIVGLFPVRIPGAKTAIAGGEIFIFLIMIVYGAPAAVLAAAVEGAVGAWRSSKRWTSRIVTPAMASISMLACASRVRGRALAHPRPRVQRRSNHRRGDGLRRALLDRQHVAYFVTDRVQATRPARSRRRNGCGT